MESIWRKRKTAISGRRMGEIAESAIRLKMNESCGKTKFLQGKVIILVLVKILVLILVKMKD